MINFATVYFPSVPEETRTNGVVNRITTTTDTIPPTTSLVISPESNSHGWNNTDVTATLTATDNENGEGVKAIHYKLTGQETQEGTIFDTTANISIFNEGTAALTFRSEDNAGNIEPRHALEIKIDKTPPVFSASSVPQPNSFGWNNTNATIIFTATDNLSGVAHTTDQIIITTEGENQLIGGEAIDFAENRKTTSCALNIDKTPPHITIATPIASGLYLLNQSVFSDWQALDSLSGIETITSTVPYRELIDTGSIGIKTFSVTAKDRAENQKITNVMYKVTYSFSGILPPIKTDEIKVFKLKSTIPVKFQLQDAQGNFVTNAVAKLSMQKFSNNEPAGELIEAISTSASTIGNVFRYDATDNQYIFNLSTKTLSTGTWQLKVELDDTAVYTVFVGLK